MIPAASAIVHVPSALKTFSRYRRGARRGHVPRASREKSFDAFPIQPVLGVIRSRPKQRVGIYAIAVTVGASAFVHRRDLLPE